MEHQISLAKLNSSWFMKLRKIYLTYNILLACFLYVLLGLNFGLELFYEFRFSSQATRIPTFQTFASHISYLAILILLCFLISILSAKAFHLLPAVVLSNEGYQRIAWKIQTFFGKSTSRTSEIIVQLVLIVVFDVLPLSAGLITGIVTGSFSMGVQALVSAGTFSVMGFALLWWIGGVAENYKRLIGFMRRSKSLLRETKDHLYKLLKRRHRDIARQTPITPSDAPAYPKAVLANPAPDSTNTDEGFGLDTMATYDGESSEDDEQVIDRLLEVASGKTPESPAMFLTSRGRSMSVSSASSFDISNFATDRLQTNQSFTRPSQQGFATGYSFSQKHTSPYSSVNSKAELDAITTPPINADQSPITAAAEKPIDDTDTVVSTLPKQVVEQVVFKFNLCLLLYYHCWWRFLPKCPSIPILKNIRWCARFRVKNIWISIVLALFFSGVLSLGIFLVWNVFVVSAVILSLVVIDILIRSFVYVPPHRPSRHRLIAVWNRSFVHRFVALLEEVYYLSPSLVFKTCKNISYVLTITLTLCAVNGLTIGLISVLIPLILSLSLLLLYILRFNLRRITKKFSANRNLQYEDVENKPIASTAPTSSSYGTSAPTTNTNEASTSAAIGQQHARRSSVLEAMDPMAREAVFGDVGVDEGVSLLQNLAFQNDNGKAAATTTTTANINNNNAPIGGGGGYFSRLFYRFEHPTLRLISVWAMFLTVLFACLIALILVFVSLGAAAGGSFIALLLLTCFVVLKRHETEIETAIEVVFFIFVFFIALVFVFGSVAQRKAPEEQTGSIGHFLPPMDLRYGICEKSWEGYSIVDYGFFSYLAYESGDAFESDLRLWFPRSAEDISTANQNTASEPSTTPSDWQRTAAAMPGPKPCPDCSVIYHYNDTVSFFDYYSPSQNLSVISVRGTDLIMDVIQDFDIWKEIALLQGASLLGPVVNFWPQNLTAEIVYLVSVMEQFTEKSEKRFYYAPLDDYVAKAKTNRKVVLTGHSLGGGLAKIVGARQDVMAITFASPGVVFSRFKLNLDLEQINRVSVTVKPNHDLVTKIDMDGGLIQHIDCDANFVRCHSMAGTIQELIRTCGSDPRGRWIDYKSDA